MGFTIFRVCVCVHFISYCLIGAVPLVWAWFCCFYLTMATDALDSFSPCLMRCGRVSDVVASD